MWEGRPGPEVVVLLKVPRCQVLLCGVPAYVYSEFCPGDYF